MGADSGSKAIGECLKVNSTLTKLTLDSNEITDIGSKVIGESLKINSTLLFLDLSRNQIDDKGAKSIADGLKINKTLQEIILDDNEFTQISKSLLFEVTEGHSSIINCKLEQDEEDDEAW